MQLGKGKLLYLFCGYLKLVQRHSDFSSSKGMRPSFVLPSRSLILSEAVYLEGMQVWDSWWVLVHHTWCWSCSMVELWSFQSWSFCPPAALQNWLKRPSSGMAVTRFLANLSPFCPVQGSIAWARVGDSISRCHVSVSHHLDFGWLLAAKLS